MNNDKEHLSPLVDKVAINSDNISIQQNEFIGKINLRVKENDLKAREVIENYFHLKKICLKLELKLKKERLYL